MCIRDRASCDLRVFLKKAPDSCVGEPVPPSEPDRRAARNATETSEGCREIIVGQRKDLVPQILVRQQSDEYGLSPIGVEPRETRVEVAGRDSSRLGDDRESGQGVELAQAVQEPLVVGRHVRTKAI